MCDPVGIKMRASLGSTKQELALPPSFPRSQESLSSSSPVVRCGAPELSHAEVSRGPLGSSYQGAPSPTGLQSIQFSTSPPIISIREEYVQASIQESIQASSSRRIVGSVGLFEPQVITAPVTQSMSSHQCCFYL